MHLNRSARNPHLSTEFFIYDRGFSFVHFPLAHLLENRSITLPKDPYYGLWDKVVSRILGSCNGLLFLRGFGQGEGTKLNKVLCRFWNPATRTISNILRTDFEYDDWEFYEFLFGYDNSTDTYKVVALNSDGNDVRVITMGDNVWRTIKSFPNDTFPLLSNSGHCNSVYLNCTVNWLACMRDRSIDNRDPKYVIVSHDLRTETYSRMLPPEPFDEKLPIVPEYVCVLKGLLCFFHDIKGTDFIIWQMEEFGDEKSWTQLIKFSYQNIRMNYEIGRSYIRPLHLSENGDTLVLKINQEDRAILYNRRTNKVKKTRINNKIRWLMVNYVESLVSPS